MKKKWVTTQVPFKYMLGEIMLFKRNLVLKVQPTEIIYVDKSPAPILSPSEHLEENEAGYLMRSTPLSTTQPVFFSDDKNIFYTAHIFNRYYIDLQQSFEQYAAKFSSKTRSTIRRKIKKFSNKCGGKVIWKSYRTTDEMANFFHSAREVSSKSYQEKLLDSGLPDSKHFYQTMVNLAKKDQVRGYLLFDGNRPVAYMYCPVKDRVLLYQYLGYDPEYVNWSVGTILHWYAFEDIFNEGKFKYFDFTEGQSEHKRLYSTGSLLCGNVYIFPKNINSWFLIRTHYAINKLSKILGDILDRIGIKSKLRNLIRFGKL